MLSFSILDNKSMRRLLEAGFPGKSILNRRSVIPLIEKDFQKLFGDVKQELQQQKYVCLTCDSWTSYRRAFIGVTAHWICQTTFKRKSSALAFKRIIGRQTGVFLAKKIDEVITSYGLHGKITKVITDNGANYVKAFSVTDKDVEPTVPEDEDDPECFDPFDITELLHEIDTESTGILLPDHERCSAHNFNLVMSKDMDSYAFSSQFASLRESTISKCKDLFNKQNRSSNMADLIHSKIGRYLLTPVCVRWNSLHNSLKLVSKLFKTKQDEINSVFDVLKLIKLTSQEIDFLDEYVKVVDIVANALNVMQGENFMYTGLFTPTLLHTMEKLENLPRLKYCTELCGAIKSAIEKRFPKMLDENYVKATILHPFFKNYHFLKNDRSNTRLRNRLVDELIDELKSTMGAAEADSAIGKTSMKSFKVLSKFFNDDSGADDSADDENVSNSSGPTAEELLRSYLWSKDETIESLQKHPEVAKLFIKYNTTLTSSAASERLFSSAKNIFRMNRCSLSNERIEWQLLLKVNKYKSLLVFD